MKILEVKSLAFPEIKVIKYERFTDNRGYFTETFRKSDLENIAGSDIFKTSKIVQVNESYSKKGTVRGLHFQWDPALGKLVRTQFGHMVDLILDIRKGSPNFGKIIAYDMPQNSANDFSEWIYVPYGFAHGNFYLEDSAIEYFCTGEYNPNNEAGISPLATDIDWSLCDIKLKELFDNKIRPNALISEKDKNGHTLKSWRKNPISIDI